jgi:hypothetical protein
VVLGSVLQLLVTVNILPSLLILSILMMRAMFLQMVLKRATLHHIPEDGILYKT